MSKEFHTQWGEEVSATRLKILFDGLDIEKEVNIMSENLPFLDRGSDKVVALSDSNNRLILKLAEGSQIKEIPIAFKNLFEPFYEYILPEPVEYKDIIFYRVQVQKYLEPFNGEHKDYFPNNKIKIYAGHLGIDKDFLWRLFESYGENFVLAFCEWKKETGISGSNWGIATDGSPRIFDYGAVVNEKWREIAIIRDGYYYENDRIHTEVPK